MKKGVRDQSGGQVGAPGGPGGLCGTLCRACGRPAEAVSAWQQPSIPRVARRRDVGRSDKCHQRRLPIQMDGAKYRVHAGW